MKAPKHYLNKATIMSIKMRRLQLFTTSQCRRIRCNPGPCNYPYILESVWHKWPLQGNSSRYQRRWGGSEGSLPFLLMSEIIFLFFKYHTRIWEIYISIVQKRSHILYVHEKAKGMHNHITSTLYSWASTFDINKQRRRRHSASGCFSPLANGNMAEWRLPFQQRTAFDITIQSAIRHIRQRSVRYQHRQKHIKALVRGRSAKL